MSFQNILKEFVSIFQLKQFLHDNLKLQFNLSLYLKTTYIWKQNWNEKLGWKLKLQHVRWICVHF